MVGKKHIGKNWEQKLPNVQACLKHNLDLIKRCSCDGHLYISEPVWSEELDIEHLKKSAHPSDPNHSQSVYSNRNMRVLRRDIGGCINVIIDINAGEIKELQQLLKNHGIYLPDYDTSLILTTCKLCQSEDNSILISDDPDFYEPWRLLVKLGGFMIGDITYSTDKLMFRDYADFVSLTHKCCSCPTDNYIPLWNAWFVPLVDRKITSLNQWGKTNLAKRIARALGVMQKSIDDKPN